MALFQVPGWSVQNTPVRVVSQQASKKRKRPSSTDPQKLETAHINIEKLTSKLKQIGSDDNTQKDNVSAHSSKGPPVKAKAKLGKRAQSQKSSDGRKDTKSTSNRSQQQSSPSEKPTNGSKQREIVHPPKKKVKAKQLEPSLSKANPGAKEQMGSGGAELTTLQKSMRERLEGARFRLINENLYKSDSHTAHQMMRGDPKIFDEYHSGFRHQVLHWPTNPVQHYASVFESYPQKTVIADLGCGDAFLAKNLVAKGINVISFDLVSDNQYVVEADICERIPLPGSEGVKEAKSSGEGQIVDVVVCALSLMGVNWPTCLREAWRVLKPGGELHIAEVTSRFTDLEGFLNLVGSIGFRLKDKDESNTHFILFEFIKIPRLTKTANDWAQLLSRGNLLKPCEYKRR